MWKPANDRRATSPKRSPKSRRLLGRIVFAAHWLILVALVAGTLLAAVPLDHLEVLKGGTHVRFPQAGPDPAHRAPVELPHHRRGGVRARRAAVGRVADDACPAGHPCRRRVAYPWAEKGSKYWKLTRRWCLPDRRCGCPPRLRPAGAGPRRRFRAATSQAHGRPRQLDPRWLDTRRRRHSRVARGLRWGKHPSGGELAAS